VYTSSSVTAKVAPAAFSPTMRISVPGAAARTAEAAAEARDLDPGPCLGIWSNCHRSTGGIVRFEVARREGGLRLRTFGAGPEGALDWGEVEVERVYGEAVTGGRMAGLVAHHDLGFKSTRVEIHWKQGVAVVGAYHTFHDASGRHPYFCRQFFARTGTAARS
jgi:hypothetical protein